VKFFFYPFLFELPKAASTSPRPDGVRRKRVQADEKFLLNQTDHGGANMGFHVGGGEQKKTMALFVPVDSASSEMMRPGIEFTQYNNCVW